MTSAAQLNTLSLCLQRLGVMAEPLPLECLNKIGDHVKHDPFSMPAASIHRVIHKLEMTKVLKSHTDEYDREYLGIKGGMSDRLTEICQEEDLDQWLDWTEYPDNVTPRSAHLKRRGEWKDYGVCQSCKLSMYVGPTAHFGSDFAKSVVNSEGTFCSMACWNHRHD